MKQTSPLAWCGVMLFGAALTAVSGFAVEAALPLVPAVDLARWRPADFTDDELDLPYYLAHFHELANAIESNGPERGAIRISVWRGNANVFNARVMENILSLAYWYCLDRPWNPYRAHPAVRARLEAALDFWCRAQSADGRFSEYGAQRWSLAPTAFATKFMGETLILLKSGPPIDAALHDRVVEASRRAIHATLTNAELYEHGKHFTNQFGNVWGGGLAHFSIYPDPELRALWEKCFRDSRADFQSPAGYYYERDGPDFGYTTSTHDHNSRQAWEWLRGTPLGDEFLAKEAAWFEWLAANAVPEPDGGGFVYNRAIDTRQKHAGFRHYDSPLGEFIPLVRAFAESREERAARLKRERAELETNWPVVRPLPVGDFWAYSPYAFLHRRLHEWRPTTAERDAAQKLLPMLARDDYVRQFADGRRRVVFTFVRRPAYYAAFNAGEKISEQQRYGLGLFWTPQLGAVLQSQTASDTAAWGTQAVGMKSVYENATLPVEFVAGKSVVMTAVPGARDWMDDTDVTVHYKLGESGAKALWFGRDSVVVAVKHAGEFTETLPLLVPPDGQIKQAADRVTLTTPRGEFIVWFREGVTATTSDAPGAVLAKRVVVLTLRAKDKLVYELGGEAK